MPRVPLHYKTFALLLGLMALTPVYGHQFSAQVTRVLDGDTVDVRMRNHHKLRVRLAAIDAPESAQLYGDRAKEQLAELVEGQTVEVIWFKRDRYGRALGRLVRNGTDINLVQIQTGMAWHYRVGWKSAKNLDLETYALAENAARAAKRGLWRQSHPQEPADFRRNHNRKFAAADQTTGKKKPAYFGE